MHCQFLQSYQYQAGHNTSIWFSSVVTYHLFWQRGHGEIWDMLSEEVLGDSEQHPLICQRENAERVLRGSFILYKWAYWFVCFFATFTSKTHIYAACVSALHAVHCASLVHRGALFLQPICKFSTAFRYWQRWLLGVHPLNWSERTRAAPQPRLPLTT